MHRPLAVRRFALHARGVPFEEYTLPVKLLPTGSPDALGTRPFLDHGGRRLENPTAILDLIDAVQSKVDGRSFVPVDPAAKAQVQALQEYCMTEVRRHPIPFPWGAP